MKKRIIAFVLCFILVINLVPVYASASRDISYEEAVAGKLKELGLFKGVSDTDFDLARAPSRVEALVMLIRVLGKESEALSKNYSHPFNDVPKWANAYVGYAYEEGLTNGVSDTQFGTGNANAQMYLTFTLRSLGYSDINGADFTFKDPFTLAKKLGILDDKVDVNNFWRADAVLISFASLSVTVKGTNKSLAQKLISAGVFTQAQYNAANSLPHNGGELTAEDIYAKCSPAVFYIEVYDGNGNAFASGSGFFISSTGIAVTNFHVIEGASSAYIMTSDTNEVYEVSGVYDYSKSQDWAVIQIDGNGFSYLKIGGKDSVVGGASVYAIGSPLGLQNTISQGIISNPDRYDGGIHYIQTTAPISHGSSGGALINKYGEVIGITSAAYINGQNLNLAIPISVIEGYRTDNMMTVSTAGVGRKASPTRKGDVYDYLYKITHDYRNFGDGYTYVYEYDADFSLAIDFEDNQIQILSMAPLDGNGYIATSIFVTKDLEPYDMVSIGYDAYGNMRFKAKAYVDAHNYMDGKIIRFNYYEGSVYQSDAEEVTSVNLSNLIILLDMVFEYFGDGYTVTDLGFSSFFVE